MACTNTHSARTQGPGLCCRMISSGALAPTIGASVQVTDAAGHCGHCSVVASTSRKHPGRPVLRYKRGGAGCPTSAQGCCALLATA